MQKTVKAYAKINLFLNVKGKLENGYHEIETVMQSVDLYDIITVKKAHKGIQVQFDLAELNGSGSNTVLKAATAFFNATGIKGGAEIFVEKNIPLASGMGGGSADAAAVISCLNELYGNPLDNSGVMSAALTVGADVPFCISGGTALCGGIGEIITPLKGIPGTYIVLGINDQKKSTADAYAAIDRLEGCSQPDISGIRSAIELADIKGISQNLYNTFAGVVDKSKLNEISSVMLSCGALGCSLSGAGPTVFGIYGEESGARVCCERLADICRFTHLCTPIEVGIRRL